jgi:hypothetical protein
VAGRSPAMESPATVAKGGTRTRGPPRPNWCPWLGPRGPVVSQPREQAMATAAARWQRPPATVTAGKRMRRARHGATTVVMQPVEHEDGPRRGGVGLA